MCGDEAFMPLAECSLIVPYGGSWSLIEERYSLIFGERSYGFPLPIPYNSLRSTKQKNGSARKGARGGFPYL